MIGRNLYMTTRTEDFWWWIGGYFFLIVAVFSAWYNQWSARRIRAALGRLLSEGQQLMAICAESNPSRLPITESAAWEERVKAVLRQHLDSSYVDRLCDPTGLGIAEMSSIRLPEHRLLCAGIRVRVMRLHQFLVELA